MAESSEHSVGKLLTEHKHPSGLYKWRMLDFGEVSSLEFFCLYFAEFDQFVTIQEQNQRNRAANDALWGSFGNDSILMVLSTSQSRFSSFLEPEIWPCKQTTCLSFRDSLMLNKSSTIQVRWVTIRRSKRETDRVCRNLENHGFNLCFTSSSLIACGVAAQTPGHTNNFCVVGITPLSQQPRKTHRLFCTIYIHETPGGSCTKSPQFTVINSVTVHCCSSGNLGETILQLRLYVRSTDLLIC